MTDTKDLLSLLHSSKKSFSVDDLLKPYKEKEANKLKEKLPNLILQDNKPEPTSLCGNLIEKYPAFKFELIKLHELDVIQVMNVFKGSNHLIYIYPDYNSRILNFLDFVNIFSSANFVVLDEYIGFLNKNIFEIGAFANYGGKLLELIKDQKKLKYSIEHGSKQIIVELSEESDMLNTLFNLFFYDTNLSIKIRSINGDLQSQNEYLELLNILEENIIKKIYFEFNESIEFARLSSQYIYGQKRYFYKKKENPKSDKIILKKHNMFVLNYLRQAATLKNIPFKFITYYHAIEYFFQSCYEEYLMRLLESHHNQYDLEKINELCKEHEKHGKEIKQLELVLRRFVTLKDFKDYFEIDKNVPPRNLTDELKTELIIIDESNFYPSLSKHIYQIRNSIIHSKPNYKDLKPLYYSKNKINHSILIDEIFLVKWIAEKILDKSSQDI